MRMHLAEAVPCSFQVDIKPCLGGYVASQGAVQSGGGAWRLAARFSHLVVDVIYPMRMG